MNSERPICLAEAHKVPKNICEIDIKFTRRRIQVREGAVSLTTFERVLHTVASCPTSTYIRLGDEVRYSNILFFAGHCFLDQCVREVLELLWHLRKMGATRDLAFIRMF